MKTLIAGWLAALILVAPFSQAAESTAVKKATEASKTWLALVDAGKYDASWETASALFKGAVTKVQWESAVKGVRGPLGALKSRKLTSATFMRTLPGAPDGEYVVIQYDSQFENKAGAVETITPMLEKDGSWKVSGYYIK